MMVGKRGMACKKSMRRTTSMTEFAPPDVMAAVVEEEEKAMVVGQPGGGGDGSQDWLAAYGGDAAGQDWLEAYRACAAPARAGLRRNSVNCPPAETAAFLRACGLCCRRLGPGRDTFMYKGETAFCSMECRQQHMTQEEWKDKCAVTSMKGEAAAAQPKAGRRGPGKPGTGGTVAAA